MQTRKTRLLAGVLPMLVTVALSCEDAPTAPDGTTRRGGGAPPIVPSSISIGGRTSLAQPGDTSQLTATITFSDGTTKAATAETTWGVSPSAVISITPGGLLSALAYGTAIVTARYGSPAISAQADVRVMPDGTFVVWGHVTEANFARIDNVRVEARSAARTVTATTNADGLYRLLPVDRDAMIRAEKDGFDAEVKRVTRDGDQQLDFDLHRTNLLATVDGVYELTITASTSCTTLPAEVMRRTYTAQVAEKQGQLFVALKEANPVIYGVLGFTGSRTGKEATLVLTDDFFAEYAMIERISEDRFLTHVGRAVGEITDRRITATFDGIISVGRSLPSVIAQCRAADHRLGFVR